MSSGCGIHSNLGQRKLLSACNILISATWACIPFSVFMMVALRRSLNRHIIFCWQKYSMNFHFLWNVSFRQMLVQNVNTSFCCQSCNCCRCIVILIMQTVSRQKTRKSNNRWCDLNNFAFVPMHILQQNGDRPSFNSIKKFHSNCVILRNIG